MGIYEKANPSCDGDAKPGVLVHGAMDRPAAEVSSRSPGLPISDPKTVLPARADLRRPGGFGTLLSK